MILRFLQNERGNLALTFSFAGLLIIGGVGMALDYAGANRVKTNYQDLADSAVLAAARVRPKDEAEMARVAEETIAMIAARNAADPGDVITTTLSEDNKTVQVRIEGSYSNSFMHMFGKGQTDMSVLSETVIEFTDDVEIALVLDTTRSMQYDGRLTSLKNAANNFVDVIESVEPEDRVRISVVPFGQYVNVGTSQRNQDWLDVPPDYTQTFPPVCGPVRGPVTGQTCETRKRGPSPGRPAQPAKRAVQPTYGTCTDDGVSYRCKKSNGSPARAYQPAVPPSPGGESYQHCTNTYGPSRTQCTTRPPVVHRWNGCVGSRQGVFNEDHSYSIGEPRVPGYLNMQCGDSILPMTTNFNSVKSKINGLSVHGETYSPAGLIWGHRLVAPEEPFAFNRTTANGEPPRRVVIFMTDGFNTRSLSAYVSPNGSPPNLTGRANHEGVDRDDADRLSQDICDGMKRDPTIEIYSISFRVQDNSAKRLIENCAWDRSMYYDASDSRRLTDAFEDIALSLMTQRLTQ